MERISCWLTVLTISTVIPCLAADDATPPDVLSVRNQLSVVRDAEQVDQPPKSSISSEADPQSGGYDLFLGGAPQLPDEFDSALHQEGQHPLSYWYRRLASADDKIRVEALKAIKSNSDFQLLYRPQLLSLWDPDQQQNLERVQNEVRALLPCLLCLLHSTDDEICDTACQALNCLGTDASAACPQLLRILHSKGRSVSLLASAAQALIYVTPPNVPVGPQLWCAYRQSSLNPFQINGASTEERDRDDAFSAEFGSVILIGILSESNRTVVEIPTMLQVARSTAVPRALRLLMLTTIAGLQEEAIAAVPTLYELLSDDDRLIRLAAANALVCIKSEQADLPRIIKQLHLNAVELGRFNESLDRHREQDSHLREFLRESLKEDSIWKKDTIEPVLRTKQPPAQRQMMRMLGELGPDAKPVVPTLLTAIQISDAYTREVAIEALKKIDPSISPVYPALKTDHCSNQSCCSQFRSSVSYCCKPRKCRCRKAWK